MAIRDRGVIGPLSLFAYALPFSLAYVRIGAAVGGVYSLSGRGNRDPVAANAQSFLWSALLAILVVIVTASRTAATTWGLTLAVVSGAVTSGVGYALWYRVLPRLSVTQAAVLQLGVPVIAAAGAVVVLGEHLTSRLVLSGTVALLGVGLVLSARARKKS